MELVDSNQPSRNRQAFEILVRQHHRQLMGYAISICNREDAAKDIVQESFVTAWEKLEKFDVTKDFGAWMRGIVRNKAREWARAQNLVSMDDELLDVIELQHRQWDDASAEAQEGLIHTLGKCIEKLPDLLNQTVHLFYFQRLSGAETAEKLGADPSTVRKRLERARTQLKICIEQSPQS